MIFTVGVTLLFFTLTVWTGRTLPFGVPEGHTSQDGGGVVDRCGQQKPAQEMAHGSLQEALLSGLVILIMLL